jgi:hypothetical protein
MIRNQSHVIIAAFATALLHVASLGAQSVDSSRVNGAPERLTAPSISSLAGVRLTSIYGAVIDSVVTQERADWHRPPAEVMVLSGVYFLPWVERGRVVSAQLGPVPPLDQPIVVPPRRYESVTATQFRHMTSTSEPVFILGAVDMFNEDGCVVRVGLYQPNSRMQLFYATVRRTASVWHVTALELELQR